ncbi:hypothetical protein [Streptococcus hyovaginalis]
MKRYLVTRNLVTETATDLVRYRVGDTVEMKAAEANKLNKLAGEPFLELMQTTNKEVEEVAE